MLLGKAFIYFTSKFNRENLLQLIYSSFEYKSMAAVFIYTVLLYAYSLANYLHIFPIISKFIARSIFWPL